MVNALLINELQWVTSILSIQKETIVLILLYYFASIISLKIIVLLINCDIEIPHCSSFISNAFTILHYCCCSVAKSCPIHCDPMNFSTQGSPVLYYLPEFAQIHVHSVSDAISTILSSASPFSFCLQSFPTSVSFPKSWLFTSVAKVLELYLQQ